MNNVGEGFCTKRYGESLGELSAFFAMVGHHLNRTNREAGEALLGSNHQFPLLLARIRAVFHKRERVEILMHKLSTGLQPRVIEPESSPKLSPLRASPRMGTLHTKTTRTKPSSGSEDRRSYTSCPKRTPCNLSCPTSSRLMMIK